MKSNAGLEPFLEDGFEIYPHIDPLQLTKRVTQLVEDCGIVCVIDALTKMNGGLAAVEYVLASKKKAGRKKKHSLKVEGQELVIQYYAFEAERGKTSVNATAQRLAGRTGQDAATLRRRYYLGKRQLGNPDNQALVEYYSTHPGAGRAAARILFPKS